MRFQSFQRAMAVPHTPVRRPSRRDDLAMRAFSHPAHGSCRGGRHLLYKGAQRRCRAEASVRSFRFRLIRWFALLAIVPTLLAFYGFDTLGKRRETQRIDSRLRTDVRFAVAGYAQRLGAAERRARPGSLADVVAGLRLDLDPRDTLVAVRNGQIVAGAGRGEGLALVPSVPGRVVVGGVAYRGLITSALAAPDGVQFAALARQSELDQAISATRERILALAFAAVLGVGCLVYFLGLSIVRSLNRLIRAADTIAQGELSARVAVKGRDEFARVADAFNRMAVQLEQRLAELEDERRRTQKGTARFAEVLAATHDVDQLLRVVVETAVEVTGAKSGVVIAPDAELARTGDLEAGSQVLELPLRAGRNDFGTVVLVGQSFDGARREAAASLVAHAVVALENAHLHHVV